MTPEYVMKRVMKAAGPPYVAGRIDTKPVVIPARIVKMLLDAGLLFVTDSLDGPRVEPTVAGFKVFDSPRQETTT